jgi:hypothetical protein
MLEHHTNSTNNQIVNGFRTNLELRSLFFLKSIISENVPFQQYMYHDVILRHTSRHRLFKN